MQTTAPATVNDSRHHASTRSEDVRVATDTTSFVDNRQIAIVQRRLHEVIAGSDRVKQQKTLMTTMNESPRIVSQRQKTASLFGNSTQRIAEPQEVQRTESNNSVVVQGKATANESEKFAPKSVANPNKTGLPDQIKSGIESLSGMSMDHVKVHYNSSQPAQLNALAYAQGADIHLAPGQEQHLPHESWHVVQQAQGRVRPTFQTKGTTINDDPALEREADVMGGKAAQMGDSVSNTPTTKTRSDGVSGGAVQRQIDLSSGHAAQRQLGPAQMTSAGQVAQRAAIHTSIDVLGVDSVLITATDNFVAMGNVVHGANAAVTPARPLEIPAGTPAYVANVISTASGKDKTAAQAAAQYQKEAFPDDTDAARRFALVYLANSENKPWLPLEDLEAVIAARSSGQSPAIAGFPVTAGYSLWEREWKINGAQKTAADVRSEVAGAVNQQDAQDKVEAAAKEAGWPSSTVPNQARNTVKAMPATNAYLADFKSKGYKAFAHVGDADAVTMKVPPTEGSEASPLFSRYDQLIGDNPGAFALTGGYRFAQKPDVGDAAPPHSAGADKPGKDLMAGTRQVVEESRLDMQVRNAMAKHHGMAPYFPEPNLLVHGDIYKSDKVNFGVKKTEWENFRDAMINEQVKQYFEHSKSLKDAVPAKESAPKKWSKAYFVFKADAILPASLMPTPIVGGDHDGQFKVEMSEPNILKHLKDAYPSMAQNGFVFDTKAALVTDVGRFDKEYTDTSGDGPLGAGTNYREGELDPLALFDARALQSHTGKREIMGSINKIYDSVGKNAAWFDTIANTLVPQSLFPDLSNTRKLGDAEEKTREAATERSVDELIRIKPHLQHYKALSGAVIAMITAKGPVLGLAKAAAAERIGGVGADAVEEGNLTPADWAKGIKNRLLATGVNAGLVGILREGKEYPLIEKAIKDATTAQLPQANAILAMVKSASDAIAAFLSTYGD
jgi:hypothetical protein